MHTTPWLKRKLLEARTPTKSASIHPRRSLTTSLRKSYQLQISVRTRVCPLLNLTPSLLSCSDTVFRFLVSAEIKVIKAIMKITCPFCGTADSYARRIVGCASFSWCVCLFLTTTFVGFWIPFCVNRCYDVEVVCQQCGYIKASL